MDNFQISLESDEQARYYAGLAELFTVEDARTYDPAQLTTIVEGHRVQAGVEGTEDYDTGKIIAINGAMAQVAWDSGIRTEIPIRDLEAL